MITENKLTNLLLLPSLPCCLLVVRILGVPIHVVWVWARGRRRTVVWHLSSAGVLLIVPHILLLLLLVLCRLLIQIIPGSRLIGWTVRSGILNSLSFFRLWWFFVWSKRAYGSNLAYFSNEDIWLRFVLFVTRSRSTTRTLASFLLFLLLIPFLVFTTSTETRAISISIPPSSPTTVALLSGVTWPRSAMLSRATSGRLGIILS